MNRATHTPGPWKPRYDSPGSPWVKIVSPQRRRETNAEHVVCELRASNPEHAADVALVTAAPDLLAALQECADAIRIHEGPRSRLALAAAEAAIDKATGG